MILELIEGLKIKNIKACTLFGFNQGIRDRYDYTGAMFNNSLFRDFMEENGLNVWNGKSTRDIICLDFDFGSRSYEEEKDHLDKMLKDADTEERKSMINTIIEKVDANKDLYFKQSKEEIRELFYVNGVDVEYTNVVGSGKNKHEEKEIIHYKMLYRNSSKAKIGQVMFINEKLYDIAYDWLTMGLGNKMPEHNAKIVEMSAYAPLTTSTIVGKFHIPVEDILILKDQDSIFRTMAKIVKAEEYMKTEKVIDEEKTEAARQKAIKNKKFLADGVTPKYTKRYKLIEVPTKKCIVVDEETDVKNTLWDGMCLIESSTLPSWVNGMALLRNHFFKACGIRTYIQKFFYDWCEENNVDYDTFEIEDMFGVKHKAKDIKIITTDNAIKWKKFMNLMGNTPADAYKYWKDRVNADGSYWGIVKTDHPSKLGDVQQMSYQMVNTLPCDLSRIKDLAQTSIDYVESMKMDNSIYNDFLKKNATLVNHYQMMSSLYEHNNEFAESTWFRTEKRKVINNYMNRLRTGKITIDADNLTIFGNPYALLLYSVGEDWKNDPTINYEKGVIQCYTSRFNDGEYLCGIRNPHNSPNNICYLKNVHSNEMKRYFKLTDNILAVNCIGTDIQDRANGCDFDSDFFFVTNNDVMVESAKIAYDMYPTVVNKLKESGITYNNTMIDYARMDNKFAKSRIGIGESSNLAMQAITYFWTSPTMDLYDNFVILAVLAQIIIDGCKREYEVDGIEEIKRIKGLPCMDMFEDITDKNGNTKHVRKDYAEFMLYTKPVKITNNGKMLSQDIINRDKKKLRSRINYHLVCPMNELGYALNRVQAALQTNTIPTEQFIKHIDGRSNSTVRLHMSKIKTMVDKLYSIMLTYDLSNDEQAEYFNREYEKVIENIKKMNIKNPLVFNRLIEISFGVTKNGLNKNNLKSYTKNSRILSNILYNVNQEMFMSNFV